MRVINYPRDIDWADKVAERLFDVIAKAADDQAAVLDVAKTLREFTSPRAAARTRKPTDLTKPVLCLRCKVSHLNFETAMRLCGGDVCKPRTPADAMCLTRRCKRPVVALTDRHAWCAKHQPQPRPAMPR